MTAHAPTDDEDICHTFARHANSEGYTEAEFRKAIDNLLLLGLLRRVPYRAQDGSARYLIERAR
jgi:hypothetical protein